MVEIKVEAVRDLQLIVDDATVSTADRSLAVRRFCNEYKASGPRLPHRPVDTSVWAKVDTDHLLTISGNMPLLANYLVERVVAAE